MQLNLEKEFDRQVQNLLSMDYPSLAGISEKEFLAHLLPLKTKLKEVAKGVSIIPFVIVVKSEMVTPEKAISKITINGKTGNVNLTPVASSDFKILEGLDIPDSKIYLLVDIDTGRSTLNIKPSDALDIILKNKRSPLTIDEGVSLLTQFPEVLTNKKHFNSYQMLSSRRNGDLRIPSIWISLGKPRLGWCWNGNPHTWLGSASCLTRIGL